MDFSAKCNSGRIAIQWFHIKYYLDYQYTKFQPYRVQKCVFLHDTRLWFADYKTHYQNDTYEGSRLLVFWYQRALLYIGAIAILKVLTRTINQTYVYSPLEVSIWNKSSFDHMATEKICSDIQY